MVIVKIVGGLGNQMFLYAYAKALAEKGYNVKIDLSWFKTNAFHDGYGLNKFHIDLLEAPTGIVETLTKKSMLNKFFNLTNCFGKQTVFKEKSHLFQKSFLFPPENCYIKGYFQSEKYFISLREDILSSFKLKCILSDYTKDISRKINDSKNSVSIHIRRGDYITNEQASQTHGICGLDYYQNALRKIKASIESPHFFVFSDDMEWVEKNIRGKNFTYIKNPNSSSHEDLFLMSICNHNIIANSSFSWWGHG
jgi:hypothetical protein